MLNYDEIGWTPEFPTIGRAEGVQLPISSAILCRYYHANGGILGLARRRSRYRDHPFWVDRSPDVPHMTLVMHVSAFASIFM